MSTAAIEALGFCAALLTTFCWLPQAWQTIRTRDTSGISLWTQALFATGIVVHVFGVLHIILAGATMGRIMGIDYSAPVKAIQLRRMH